MTNPIQPNKTYGVLHTESFFSFLGFAKKIGSDEPQKIDIYLDNKLIDTIEANEFIQKIDDMYDVENQAFSYNLPSKYIGQKSTISFKNHNTQDELLNSPYTLIDKNHEKFNEAKFMHSLNEPISEELKNMYKPNCIGFLATKENLEDEEFVEYINQIMVDFPEYDFKSLYFDKNSIKEIKEKFKHSSLELLELKDIKVIYNFLEIFLQNNKDIRHSLDFKISIYLQNNSIQIIPFLLNLHREINIKDYCIITDNFYDNFFINLELFGFNQDDTVKYGNSFIEVFYKKAIEIYKVKTELVLTEHIRKFLYVFLKISLNNHQFIKDLILFRKKHKELKKQII
ncbi:hypothetical protein H0A43_01725 [Arcobacter lanthieri]|uniref:hypothetical protein n=1 Tax=Aliarcobacter lanthieri TaxID=1355374 RepID=UPI001921FA7D|nr:hypothetical protein [Aliarcobacter lanthieri]MBL3519177.1 hypothetical protein [Aliarcobacter lanthieri]